MHQDHMTFTCVTFVKVHPDCMTLTCAIILEGIKIMTLTIVEWFSVLVQHISGHIRKIPPSNRGCNSAILPKYHTVDSRNPAWSHIILARVNHFLHWITPFSVIIYWYFIGYMFLSTHVRTVPACNRGYYNYFKLLSHWNITPQAVVWYPTWSHYSGNGSTSFHVEIPFIFPSFRQSRFIYQFEIFGMTWLGILPGANALTRGYRCLSVWKCIDKYDHCLSEIGSDELDMGDHRRVHKDQMTLTCVIIVKCIRIIIYYVDCRRGKVLFLISLCKDWAFTDWSTIHNQNTLTFNFCIQFIKFVLQHYSCHVNCNFMDIKVMLELNNNSQPTQVLFKEWNDEVV